MHRVIRRALWALGAASLALLVAAGVAPAAAPPGPRLAIVKFTLQPQRLELLSVDPLGAQPVRLAGGGRNTRPLPYPFAFLAWRPDGSQLAFSGVVGSGKGREGPPPLKLFLVNAEGGSPQPVPGTANGYGPVFSPDGRTLAFTRIRQRETVTRGANGKTKRRRYESATVWVVDLETGAQRRLTPWRNGLEYIASSFSPDGSTLLTTRQDDRRTDTPEPIALRLDGGGSTRLLVDGLFPVYSPDGSEIALFREQAEDSDLFVLDVATGALRRLTRTPGTIELFASWDPSGERLAFVRFSAANSEAASIGFGDSIVQINADGTCPTKTLSAPRTAFYVPAWQPGPGREAGRIAC
jgi:Tol biopolymer transport system component